MLSMDVGSPRNEIPYDTFAKLGSCAAMGAATFKSGFFGVSADVRFMINGVKSSEPFVITESQPFGKLMHDETSNTSFVACYGGMLKASEQDMSASLILSTNQMSVLEWSLRPQLEQDHTYLTGCHVAGNRKARIHQRNGHPGIFYEPITPSDPRWATLPRMWVSENTAHHPKCLSRNCDTGHDLSHC